jgi:hypothetical protein
MNSCPEKTDLYRFLDEDLSAEKAEEINQHIRHCQNCRIEIEEIVNNEKAVRNNFDKAFSAGNLKEKVFAEIARLKVDTDQSQIKNLSARKIWFWIFAPGLAIIFFAALLNTMQLLKSNGNIVQLISCQAVGKNAFFNNQPIVPGKEINLDDLTQPVSIEGNFIFKVTSNTTSTFSHIGKSVLKPVKNLQLEFINSAAVFKLLEGKPIKVKINQKEHWLNKKSLKTAFWQRDKKISRQKNKNSLFNEKCATDTKSMASNSKIIINKDKKHSNQIEENESSSSIHSSTAVGPNVASESLSDGKTQALASTSSMIEAEKQPANPFEDKPLLIERK